MAAQSQTSFFGGESVGERNSWNSGAKKRERLLFITKTYPFGEGEDFVEIELRKLAQYFDVSIFPIDCRGRQRTIGVEGVTAYQWKWSIPRILGSALRGLFSRNFWKDLRRAPGFFQFLLKGRPALRTLSRHAQAVYLKPLLLRVLAGHDFAVVYSFWGDSGALCLSRLQDSPPWL